jgi:hypothetical protein
MLAFSTTSRRNLKACLAPAATATTLCTLALLGLASTPAHAKSPVSPLEHNVFVIGPDDGGACSFPVQWDVTTRGFGIDRPPSFLTMSPNWHLTLTNVDTGRTWTPHGDGTITFQEQNDGTILQTLNGVNYAPVLDQQLIGTWSRIIDPDTSTASDWVGRGTIVDICDKLS